MPSDFLLNDFLIFLTIFFCKIRLKFSYSWPFHPPKSKEVVLFVRSAPPSHSSRLFIIYFRYIYSYMLLLSNGKSAAKLLGPTRCGCVAALGGFSNFEY